MTIVGCGIAFAALMGVQFFLVWLYGRTKGRSRFD